MHDLSDEVSCARWIENPYYQYFCGEESFRHALAFDRSSLTRWRQRLGEEQLAALLQESLSVAHRTGALATKDLERVVVGRPPRRLTAAAEAALAAVIIAGPDPARDGVLRLDPGAICAGGWKRVLPRPTTPRA